MGVSPPLLAHGGIHLLKVYEGVSPSDGVSAHMNITPYMVIPPPLSVGVGGYSDPPLMTRGVRKSVYPLPFFKFTLFGVGRIFMQGKMSRKKLMQGKTEEKKNSCKMGCSLILNQN